MTRRSLLALLAPVREIIIAPGDTGPHRWHGNGLLIHPATPGAVELSEAILSGANNTLSGFRFVNPRLRVEGTGHTVADCTFTESTPPPKSTDTKWISLYGENHTFRHNYIAGKTNRGATLVVWLPKGSSAPVRHHITRNHFGPRPALGENGGETIRVGDSATSLQPAACLIDQNWLTHCDGEIEIISNKSCDNIYRANVFDRCDGTLTLRHGNRCLVERNVFLGANYKSAGGIRIIGEDHRVLNNYLEHLPGRGNRAAISLMQGIVDTPLNGYAQVRRAVIHGNTIVACAQPYAPSVPGKGTSLAPVDITYTDNRELTTASRPEFISLSQVGPSWQKSG